MIKDYKDNMNLTKSFNLNESRDNKETNKNNKSCYNYETKIVDIYKPPSLLQKPGTDESITKANIPVAAMEQLHKIPNEDKEIQDVINKTQESEQLRHKINQIFKKYAVPDRQSTKIFNDLVGFIKFNNNINMVPEYLMNLILDGNVLPFFKGDSGSSQMVRKAMGYQLKLVVPAAANWLIYINPYNYSRFITIYDTTSAPYSIVATYSITNRFSSFYTSACFRFLYLIMQCISKEQASVDNKLVSSSGLVPIYIPPELILNLLENSNNNIFNSCLTFNLFNAHFMSTFNTQTPNFYCTDPNMPMEDSDTYFLTATTTPTYIKNGDLVASLGDKVFVKNPSTTSMVLFLYGTGPNNVLTQVSSISLPANTTYFIILTGGVTAYSHNATNVVVEIVVGRTSSRLETALAIFVQGAQVSSTLNLFLKLLYDCNVNGQMASEITTNVEDDAYDITPLLELLYKKTNIGNHSQDAKPRLDASFFSSIGKALFGDLGHTVGGFIDSGAKQLFSCYDCIISTPHIPEALFNTAKEITLNALDHDLLEDMTLQPKRIPTPIDRTFFKKHETYNTFGIKNLDDKFRKLFYGINKSKIEIIPCQTLKFNGQYYEIYDIPIEGFEPIPDELQDYVVPSARCYKLHEPKKHLFAMDSNVGKNMEEDNKAQNSEAHKKIQSVKEHLKLMRANFGIQKKSKTLNQIMTYQHQLTAVMADHGISVTLDSNNIGKNKNINTNLTVELSQETHGVRYQFFPTLGKDSKDDCLCCIVLSDKPVKSKDKYALVIGDPDSDDLKFYQDISLTTPKVSEATIIQFLSIDETFATYYLTHPEPFYLTVFTPIAADIDGGSYMAALLALLICAPNGQILTSAINITEEGFRLDYMKPEYLKRKVQIVKALNTADTYTTNLIYVGNTTPKTRVEILGDCTIVDDINLSVTGVRAMADIFNISSISYFFMFVKLPLSLKAYTASYYRTLGLITSTNEVLDKLRKTVTTAMSSYKTNSPNEVTLPALAGIWDNQTATLENNVLTINSNSLPLMARVGPGVLTEKKQLVLESKTLGVTKKPYFSHKSSIFSMSALTMYDCVTNALQYPDLYNADDVLQMKAFISGSIPTDDTVWVPIPPLNQIAAILLKTPDTMAVALFGFKSISSLWTPESSMAYSQIYDLGHETDTDVLESVLFVVFTRLFPSLYKKTDGSGTVINIPEIMYPTKAKDIAKNCVIKKTPVPKDLADIEYVYLAIADALITSYHKVVATWKLTNLSRIVYYPNTITDYVSRTMSFGDAKLWEYLRLLMSDHLFSIFGGTDETSQHIAVKRYVFTDFYRQSGVRRPSYLNHQLQLVIDTQEKYDTYMKLYHADYSNFFFMSNENANIFKSRSNIIMVKELSKVSLPISKPEVIVSAKPNVISEAYKQPLVNKLPQEKPIVSQLQIDKNLPPKTNTQPQVSIPQNPVYNPNIYQLNQNPNVYQPGQAMNQNINMNPAYQPQQSNPFNHPNNPFQQHNILAGKQPQGIQSTPQQMVSPQETNPKTNNGYDSSNVQTGVQTQPKESSINTGYGALFPMNNNVVQQNINENKDADDEEVEIQGNAYWAF